MCHSCEGKCVTAPLKGRQNGRQAAWMLVFRVVTVNVSLHWDSEGKCVTTAGLGNPDFWGLLNR